MAIKNNFKARMKSVWILTVEKTKILSKKSLDTIALVSLISWAMFTGYVLHADTAHADYIPQIQRADAPVMVRIAKCESSTGHIGKDGQVARHVNTDGSIDMGKYMINSIHFKEASKMGFDLTKESDNKAFAMWLYANHGTGDWSSSSKCWNK